MWVKSLNLLLLLVLLRWSILSFWTQHIVKLISLPFPNLIRAMIFNKSIYSFIAASHSHDHLIVFSFNKNPLLSICVDSFLFSDKEKACLAMSLIIVDILGQLFISWIILNGLINKIHSLEIIHVLVHPF